MKFKETINITVRGFKTINELLPGCLLFASLKSVMEALLPFVNIYMSGRVITGIAEKMSLEELAFLALLTVALNFITTMLINGLTRIVNVKRDLFWYVMDVPLDRKMQTMDYERIEDSETHAMRADIILKETSRGRGLPRLVWMYVDIGLRCFFQLIFSIALVAGAFLAKPAAAPGVWSVFFSPWTTLLLIGLFILSLVWDIHNNSASAKKEEKTAGDSFVNMDRVARYYGELFLGYRAGKDLKLYNLRDSVLGEFMGITEQFNRIWSKCQSMKLRYQAVSEINATVVSGIIYVYIAVKALFGAFAVGNIVQYVGSLTQFTSGFGGLVTMISDIFINREALEEFFAFIDMPDKKYQGTLPVEKRAFCQDRDNDYEIEFRDVSFKYPGSESYALRHVSIKFSVGDRMAVVGKNGSGKTTFIKLLCRLYDPTQGEILLNGIDIRKYDYEEYMSLFSVVFQDFSLFSFSLGQNVAASVEVDKEKAKACLYKAGFGDRLEKMPRGLDTCLYKDFEEEGVEISGGEAQKIALARALYKDAPFIVLDEPTAALDPIAEYEVYSKFNEMVEDKTAIYISHRLSSCRFCDSILVFDEGEIVQRGSHEELVSDVQGRYHELWQAQAQYYREDESR